MAEYKSKRSRLVNVGFLLVAVVGVSIALWFGLDLIYVSTGNVTDDVTPADVIIVLGCPTYEGNVVSTTFSSCLQARAHHAAGLYQRGLSPHIIATGGLTGPPPTEAEAMAEVLRSTGVSGSALSVEDQALDTAQNIQYSRAIMEKNGWRTAILVTEPNHIRRAALIARDAGLNISLSPVTESPGWNTLSARYDNLIRDARTLMGYQLRSLTAGAP